MLFTRSVIPQWLHSMTMPSLIEGYRPVSILFLHSGQIDLVDSIDASNTIRNGVIYQHDNSSRGI